jgi:ferredoxin
MILAAEDGVALDSFITHTLGRDSLEIPTTRIAYEQGLGEVNIGKMEVLGEVPVIHNFKWPHNISYTLEMIPSPLARGLMKFWWTRPAINPEKCNQCKKCQESCPTSALGKPGQLADDQRSYIPEFDYGDCINCLCCMEMCPQKAVYQDKSILYRLTSLFSDSQ